ncbi:DUF5821 family protein [Halobaculum sp. MBLA0143]|uniref:transcriptional regulator TbsP domain-containing protein n=1 Tax=Halobaculum sp. MBLA0143 TaxID=3079933 RepID=UPI0035251107
MSSVEPITPSALAERMGESGDEWTVLAPERETLVKLARGVAELDDPPALEIVADGKTLRETLRLFPTNARLGDLSPDRLSLWEADVEAMTTELVGSSVVVSELRTPGERTFGVSTDHEFVAALADEAASIQKSAVEFGGRLPGLSRVFESAADRLGPELAADLETAVALTDDPTHPDSIHAVRVALLAASAQDLLFYDVTSWVESRNIASKATCSRHRGRLEDRGVLTSSSVADGGGRPRKRCHLAEPYASRYEREGIEPLLQQCCF